MEYETNYILFNFENSIEKQKELEKKKKFQTHSIELMAKETYVHTNGVEFFL